MENEKLFGFIRRRGTLGILTLVLVGIVAFASYRTSYPVTTETEQTEAVKEASGTGAQQKNVQNPLQEYQNTRETGTVSAQKNDVSAGSVSEDVTAGTLEEAAAAGSGEVTANGKNTDTAVKSIKAAEVKTEAETEKETEEADPVVSGSVISPTVQFSEDATLSWPAAGTILMDYSMDGTKLSTDNLVQNPLRSSVYFLHAGISRHTELQLKSLKKILIGVHMRLVL